MADETKRENRRVWELVPEQVMLPVLGLFGETAPRESGMKDGVGHVPEQTLQPFTETQKYKNKHTVNFLFLQLPSKMEDHCSMEDQWKMKSQQGHGEVICDRFQRPRSDKTHNKHEERAYTISRKTVSNACLFAV